MLPAAIPSPGFNALHIGAFQLRLYGLSIMCGVLVAVSVARRRWAARGGDPDDVSAICLWAVPAGLVGARLYHVITDWRRFEGRWLDVFAIWKGGLGIPGGVLLGTLVGVLVARRRGLPVVTLMDVAAPAIPLAQAIGRLGNYFNQELFGRPTELPWALRIDVAHRPSGYEQFATFHPTFLYEALWNLALAGVLILVDRTRRLRPGELFTLYVLGYAVGRLWIEELRIDDASLIAGIRVNIWVSLLAIAGALAVFARRRHRSAGAGDVAGVDANPADANPADPNRADANGADQEAVAGRGPSDPTEPNEPNDPTVSNDPTEPNDPTGPSGAKHQADQP